MKFSLKIAQTVIDKLSAIKDIQKPAYAKIYGTHHENTTILLAVQLEDIYIDKFQYALPTGVDARGILCINNQPKHENQEVIKILSAKIDVTDNPIFFSYCLSGDKQPVCAYVLVHGQLKVQPYTLISEQEIQNELVYLRLTGDLTLTVSPSSYDEIIANLKNSITSGQYAFNFSKTQIYLLGPDQAASETLLKDIGSINEDIKKQKESRIKILEVNLMKNLTKEIFSGTGEQHAPICIVTKKKKDIVNIPVKIDMLSLVHKQSNISNLYGIIVESLDKYLNHFDLALNFHEKKKIDDIVLPQVYHCYPKGCGHFVSIWLLKNLDQKTVQNDRKLLHEKLLLPTNQPMFRRENGYNFKMNPDREPLLNVHESLKDTNNGGKIALVRGNYSYYHYEQGNMNDTGWGCAYRSLQTLASWFRLQGYTDKEVPTFEEIQKCLVDIGDKPASFIGSRQWIGSMEVNFVLNTLLNVTCRIVNVSNGAEMAYEGPQLVRHFEDYGTPIMIGGGQLAHTILGVDYNQATGGIRFLVLDPHYTGSDDMQIIQNKGWCGWKNVDFWSKTSYYNMCLPLVPSGV